MASTSVPLTLQPSVPSYTSLSDKTFSFLNLSHTFQNGIDWNFPAYGKLWTYNLTYFDFLQQESVTKEEGLLLINDFIRQADTHKDALEPFPISLRGINWVKFLTHHKINDKKIDDSLYAQYNILMDNLEYHLLGNHLLENGFSLLFGAYYFQDDRLYAQAKKILTAELNEQILEDGAHFELSPMYHQIMLYRLLDCINLVQNNKWIDDGGWLTEFLRTKASKMLGWIETISYKNGDIPLFNDSARSIAPLSEELLEYAHNLKLFIQHSTLSESGYRKIVKPHYECIIDVGPIGPDYIPGHAHADTFNFELYIENKPFIVDTGLSTYDIGENRDYERSTKAHNTVEINGENSSEVWGGFRVADRAKVIELVENIDHIQATHDGYKKKFGILHTRSWKFEENKIIIEDRLNKKCDAVFSLHFHPDITEEDILEKIQNSKFKIQNYNFSPEFNKTSEALVLEIQFKKELKVEITL